jgi:hypothetical protein
MNGPQSKFETHLFEYEHDGKSWLLEVCANSVDDAEQRLQRLPFASYKGVVKATIPARLGFLARASVWFRNALRRS